MGSYGMGPYGMGPQEMGEFNGVSWGGFATEGTELKVVPEVQFGQVYQPAPRSCNQAATGRAIVDCTFKAEVVKVLKQVLLY
jgi:hypothetical protein